MEACRSGTGGMRWSRALFGAVGDRRRRSRRESPHDRAWPLGLERCEPRRLLAITPIDVQVFLDDGQVLTGGLNKRLGGPSAIVDYQQVFTYDFARASSGVVSASDPGLNASVGALPPLWRSNVTVVSGLSYWDGSGAAPSFAPVAGGVEINLKAGTNNLRVGAGSGSGTLFVQTVPSSGEIHYHLTSNIGVGGSGQSFATPGGPDGIYAFQATVGLDPPSSSTGLAPARSSLPVWFVFSLDADDATGWDDVVVRARDHLRDRAIGTATLALAVDDGASATDGVSTDGTLAIGQLNPRASWEVSTNGGATWAALGRDARFVLPQGTYAAGRVHVRQRVTDHYGPRTVVGANTQAFTIAEASQPQPPAPEPPTPQPPTPQPPNPEPPAPEPPTPQPPTPEPPTPQPPTPQPPTPEPPTPQPPLVRPPAVGPWVPLPPVESPPPTTVGGRAEIPLLLSAMSGPIDRLTVEDLTLFRGRRRVSLAAADIVSGPDGHTLVVPRRLVATRHTYRLVIGGDGAYLPSNGVPLREVATMTWRRPPPSRSLVLAIRATLRWGAPRSRFFRYG